MKKWNPKSGNQGLVVSVISQNHFSSFVGPGQRPLTTYMKTIATLKVIQNFALVISAIWLYKNEWSIIINILLLCIRNNKLCIKCTFNIKLNYALKFISKMHNILMLSAYYFSVVTSFILCHYEINNFWIYNCL